MFFPLRAVPLPGERGAMTGRGTPSRFLTAVLYNGVGRYVRQLQRLQLLFSPTSADARGARYRWTRRRPDCRGRGGREREAGPGAA